MCFLLMRFGDCQLDEKERQEGENGRLEKSDEYLEHHQGYRKEVGHEIRRDENDDLAGEDVAEEPERERDHADQFADELDQPHRKPYRGAQVDELLSVFDNADSENACDLDHEERDDGEHERDVEIGVDAPEEREKFLSVPKAETSHPRYEFEDVGCEYEKKDGHEQGKEFARHFPALKRLEFAGDHLELAAYEKCDRDQNGDDYPTCDERVGDGNAEKLPELFGGDRHVDTFLHART